ncbi:hypothetical protein, partial [Salmonella enterica]|uniref:hypothetical protein n=1 Tax=Salmonella enterica TaxID=28901 RepID=UPI0038B77FE6
MAVKSWLFFKFSRPPEREKNHIPPSSFKKKKKTIITLQPRTTKIKYNLCPYQHTCTHTIDQHKRDTNM